MLDSLKTKLYFPVASYFRFFANIRLNRWNPRILVVTGSNGKTTLLSMLEAQFGERAKYSHHANSSYGIPFDILDLHRKTLKVSEWINLILKAPLQAFKKPFKESIYIVEADTDRAGEGKFLAEFLKPEVVLWVSVGATHGMNFEHLVKEGKFPDVKEAIAYDFGYFLEYCRKYAIVNGDLPLEMQQVQRAKAAVKVVKKSGDLQGYAAEKKKTTFTLNGITYEFKSLLPEEILYSIEMCKEAVDYFGLPFDTSFSQFILPPGRGTILQGIKQTTLIDSSYNANLSSMLVMLSMFAKFSFGKKKWVVLSDMLELGEKEQEEHEKLAEALADMHFDKIILVGSRVTRYTHPKLSSIGLDDETLVCFVKQKEALDFIVKNLTGGEAILFKGSQSVFLEGIIEPLLQDKKDADKLPRRETFWEEKRKKAGI